jgi:hypothetical protein
VCVCVCVRARVRLCFTKLPASLRACRAAVRGGSAGAGRAALLFSAGQHTGRVMARNTHRCEYLCRPQGRDEFVSCLLPRCSLASACHSYGVVANNLSLSRTHPPERALSLKRRVGVWCSQRSRPLGLLGGKNGLCHRFSSVA